MVKKIEPMMAAVLLILLPLFYPCQIHASSMESSIEEVSSTEFKDSMDSLNSSETSFSIEDVEQLVGSIPYDLWPEAPEINSKSAIVVERNTGVILYEKNCTEKRFPASTTKMMTALLTLENTSLDEIVTYSWKAVNTIGSGSSHIGMRTGDRLNVRDSLCGLLIPSANEVANALAEHIAGSVDEFAEMMNTRGKELGLINSNFANANGLHDVNHYTCAYDLYLILDACVEIPDFIEISSTKAYVKKADDILNRDIPMGTTNKMLKKDSVYYNANVVCGKTGYTSEAGRVLATYAEKDGMELICVTMGATGENHFTDTNLLLDYGFSNFSMNQLSADSTQGSGNDIANLTPLNIERTPFLLSVSLEQGEVLLPNTISIEDLSRSYKTEVDGTKYLEYHLNGYVLGNVRLTGEKVKNNAFIEKDSYTSSLCSIDGTLYTVPVWLIGVGLIVIILVSVFIGRGILLKSRKYEKKAIKSPSTLGRKNHADEKIKYSRKFRKKWKEEEQQSK